MKCDKCKKEIEDKNYIEVEMRLGVVGLGATNEALEQHWCLSCAETSVEIPVSWWE
jgi:hypothetical protein